MRWPRVSAQLLRGAAANSGIRAASPAAAVAASRRFAVLAIQAFQAAPQASPLPPVPRLAPLVIPAKSTLGWARP